MERPDAPLTRRRLALIAVLVAALVVAGAFALRDPLPTRRAQVTQARPLPIALAPGERTPELSAVLAASAAKRFDEAARLLETAARTLGEGDLRVATIRASLAFRSRPDSALNRLQTLSDDNRESPFVRLQLGLALLLADQGADSAVELREARALDPDGYYGEHADDALHLEIRPGYPLWISSHGLPAKPLSELRADAVAAPRSLAAQLAYAQLLQRTSRSQALVVAQTALALAPGNVEAAVAVAVLGFDKDRPARSTGALGLLARANPGSATVQFHFGEVLSWLMQRAAADRRYRIAAKLDPTGQIGSLAAAVLQKEETP